MIRSPSTSFLIKAISIVDGHGLYNRNLNQHPHFVGDGSLTFIFSDYLNFVASTPWIVFAFPAKGFRRQELSIPIPESSAEDVAEIADFISNRGSKQ